MVKAGEAVETGEILDDLDMSSSLHSRASSEAFFFK